MSTIITHINYLLINSEAYVRDPSGKVDPVMDFCCILWSNKLFFSSDVKDVKSCIYTPFKFCFDCLTDQTRMYSFCFTHPCRNILC